MIGTARRFDTALFAAALLIGLPPVVAQAITALRSEARVEPVSGPLASWSSSCRALDVPAAAVPFRDRAR
ncbi:hypothetical protein ACFXGA_30585 [Actinosynnema sp. NPDC059335]|uniref:hypothetical protein n=1 Tax=Actinosynnema sp. NPDC059335 TaxID=3346804 RepID=UPI003672C001